MNVDLRVDHQPIQPLKPIAFGGLTAKKESISPIKLAAQGVQTTEVQDMHSITMKATEQNLEAQNFPTALAMFMNQDKALMPTRPALTAIVGHKLKETFDKKEEPESSFYIGAEVEQAVA